MLDDLRVEPVEAVGGVLIGVLMDGNRVEAATSGVVGRRSPVEREGGGRVQIGRIDAETGG